MQVARYAFPRGDFRIFTAHRTHTMSDSYEYIPGTCNIGPYEIRKRLRLALYSLAIFLLLAAGFVIFAPGDPWLRLLLFFPASGFGTSFLQWYSKFCLKFGLTGVFNFGDKDGAMTVTEKEYRAKDIRKAWSLLAGGVLIGAAMTAGFFFLPL